MRLTSLTAALLVVASVASSSAQVTPPALRLPRLFGNGMVLQRDQPITVWGWAAPGTAVTLAFRSHAARATAGRDGRWRATLPASAAGGPFVLDVRSGGDHLTLHDVLVGDVWVASGQSNMEFTVAQGNAAEQEIAAAHDSSIRQFKIPNAWADSASDEVLGGPWTPADPEHVGSFSGVAYYFARSLRQSVHVPIGIVNATWSGSNIETWLSRDALHMNDSGWAAIQSGEARYQSSVRDSLIAKLGTLPTHDEGLTDAGAPWADPALDDARWANIHVPAYWEPQGYPGMDGVAWYRIAVTLDSADVARAQTGATLLLSAVDDDDITWINGVEVGRTRGYDKHRAYRLPARALRVGRNVVAVRVTDGGGGGGINGSVSLDIGGANRSLDGTWKFNVGAVVFNADAQHINKIPTITYNQMIHPILPFAIKGVIWYQGESNANNAAQAAAYREQFATLITSWRRVWGGGGGRSTFPFLWVQLPNFGAADSTPPSLADSAWADAAGFDDGGPLAPQHWAGDHHRHRRREQPPSARQAGRRRPPRARGAQGRVSSNAHRLRPDLPLAYSPWRYGARQLREHRRGPRRSVERRKRPQLCHRRARPGIRLGQRQDRRQTASTSGAIASSSPVAVRYAWANNPARANLYNRDGLPAAPFRTDGW